MRINNVTPVMNNTSNSKMQNNNKVAFSGNIANSLKDMVKLERAGNMTRKLFTINAFAFLLGGRLATSRDPNEIRETATRDIPAILVSVFGIPVVEDYIADKIHKKSGFAICQSNAKGGLEPATYSQLKDWYKYDENLSSGFKGFTERLHERGGNLKKIYSSLSPEMNTELSAFSQHNDEFMKQLFDCKNSTLKTKIETVFKSDNKALTQAKWLKTVPTIVGFGITLTLLGIMIPKLNIAITHHLNKNKKADDKSVA